MLVLQQVRNVATAAARVRHALDCYMYQWMVSMKCPVLPPLLDNLLKLAKLCCFFALVAIRAREINRNFRRPGAAYIRKARSRHGEGAQEEEKVAF
jgi:hypothetical protein